MPRFLAIFGLYFTSGTTVEFLAFRNSSRFVPVNSGSERKERTLCERENIPFLPCVRGRTGWPYRKVAFSLRNHGTRSWRRNDTVTMARLTRLLRDVSGSDESDLPVTKVRNGTKVRKCFVSSEEEVCPKFSLRSQTVFFFSKSELDVVYLKTRVS